MKTLYLDIETLDAIPPDRDLNAVRFGIAVTHYQDKFYYFQPDDIMKLWIQLCNAEQVVGWNILHFDLPIIARAAGCDAPLLTEMFRAWPVYDLFDEIRAATGRWYKLDAVAQRNGLRPKLADGLQTVAWLQDWQTTGNKTLLQNAFEYCQHDVQLVIDLANILRRDKQIILPAQQRKGMMTEITFHLPEEK